MLKNYSDNKDSIKINKYTWRFLKNELKVVEMKFNLATVFREDYLKDLLDWNFKYFSQLVKNILRFY
jgi:hypothetical protein